MPRLLREMLGPDAPLQSHREGDKEFWIPSRCLSGPFVHRLKDAWLVLTDRAVAVQWPEDREQG